MCLYVEEFNNLILQYGNYSAINSTIYFPLAYVTRSYSYLSGYIGDCVLVIKEQALTYIKTSGSYFGGGTHTFHRGYWLSIGY